jgi:hypothetical protein
MTYLRWLQASLLCACLSGCSQYARIQPSDATALISEGHDDSHPYVVTTVTGERRKISYFDHVLVIPKSEPRLSNGHEAQTREPGHFHSPLLVKEREGLLVFEDEDHKQSFEPSGISELQISRRALHRGLIISGIGVGAALLSGFVVGRASGCYGGASDDNKAFGCTMLVLNVGALVGGLSLLYTIPKTSQLRN